MVTVLHSFHDLPMRYKRKRYVYALTQSLQDPQKRLILLT